MNPIFRYNSNTKYLTKDLESGYNSNDFSLLDVHLKEKGPFVKIQLLIIFKDHHIVQSQVLWHQVMMNYII